SQPARASRGAPPSTRLPRRREQRAGPRAPRPYAGSTSASSKPLTSVWDSEEERFDYASGVLARLAAIGAVALVATGCGGSASRRNAPADPAPRRPFLPESVVRSPHARTTMDTNPANLASAVVTYSFGQLPE